MIDSVVALRGRRHGKLFSFRINPCVRVCVSFIVVADVIDHLPPCSAAHFRHARRGAANVRCHRSPIYAQQLRALTANKIDTMTQCVADKWRMANSGGDGAFFCCVLEACRATSRPIAICSIEFRQYNLQGMRWVFGLGGYGSQLRMLSAHTHTHMPSINMSKL